MSTTPQAVTATALPTYVPSNTSPVTIALLTRLSTETEDRIPFDVLDQLIQPVSGGKTIHNGAMHYLRQARKLCAKLHYVNWGLEDAGVKRLTSEETTKQSQRRTGHIRRHTRHSVNLLQCVDPKQLSEDERVTYNAQCALHGTLHLFTSARAVKKLEQQGASEAPNLPQLLEAMK